MVELRNLCWPEVEIVDVWLSADHTDLLVEILRCVEMEGEGLSSYVVDLYKLSLQVEATYVDLTQGDCK